MKEKNTEYLFNHMSKRIYQKMNEIYRHSVILINMVFTINTTNTPIKFKASYTSKDIVKILETKNKKIFFKFNINRIN